VNEHKSHWTRVLQCTQTSRGDFLEASHQHHLPGISCEKCGETWVSIASAYPTVKLPKPLAKVVDSHDTIGVEHFRALARQLCALLPLNAPVLPGMALGPLIGIARGEFSDVSWLEAWQPILTLQARRKLEACGVVLRAARVEARLVPKSSELYEIELPEVWALDKSKHEPDKRKSCSHCGRIGFSRPEPLYLRPDLDCEGSDIIRVREFPTIILARARLRCAVQECRLNGITLA
jgi:uncharacterized double-CXXCG motif protein